MTFTLDNLWRNAISIVLTTLQRHFFTVQSWFNGPNTAILLVYSMEKVWSTLYIKILIHDDFRYRLALLSIKDEPKRTLGRVASNHQRRPTCAITTVFESVVKFLLVDCWLLYFVWCMHDWIDEVSSSVNHSPSWAASAASRSHFTIFI